MKNKRGQFFIIAAIIIITVIISIVTISNYSQPIQTVKLYDLGQQLEIESQQVLDYGTYNQLNDSEMKTLMENFISNYVTYIGQDRNIYFVFGNSQNIYVKGYQQIINESVCVKLNPVTSVCGNGVVEDGEQCDDGTNNGVTGDPCSSTCTLVKSTITPQICGDGIVEGNEQCDDGTNNGVTGDPCSSTCTLQPVTDSAQCGDGIIEKDKQCDGTNLNGFNCNSLGFNEPAGESAGQTALQCTNCGFDTSNCIKPAYCGDGIAESGKQCEGTNINGKTCTSLGFSSGTLACDNTCNLNTTNCVAQPGPECQPLSILGQSQSFNQSQQTGSQTISKVSIKIASNEYQFTLKPGENFYFVIWENSGGEKNVVTSQQ